MISERRHETLGVFVPSLLYPPSFLHLPSPPGEESVTQWVCPFTTEKHWKAVVMKALQESPHLAVQLKDRLPGNEVVVKEVTSFVQQQPLAFITIPKALKVRH